MTFPDIVPSLKSSLPALRGRLLANEPLAPLTWFRVGGPAQALFMPEDERDLAYLLANLAAEIPVTVVRLGRGFNEIKAEGTRVRAGTAAPDLRVAKAAQEAGTAGLAFLRGIPGAIGGALRMNGGAYGRETKDALVEARGLDRQGTIRVFQVADMGYAFRHCGVAEDIIFTDALFEGTAGDAATIAAEMDSI